VSSIVVDSTLDRQLDVGAPDKAWVIDNSYINTSEGYLSGHHRRTLLPQRLKLVDAKPPDNGYRAPIIIDGCLAAKATGKGSWRIRIRYRNYQHGLGIVPEESKSGSFDEPTP